MLVSILLVVLGLTTLKVVICGKHINLNKITKNYYISLKFNRLLILLFSRVYNAKLRHMLFKKSVLIRNDQREFLCAKSKEIASLMKTRSTLKVP